jgi:hypothetical protein
VKLICGIVRNPQLLSRDAGARSLPPASVPPARNAHPPSSLFLLAFSLRHKRGGLARGIRYGFVEECVLQTVHGSAGDIMGVHGCSHASGKENSRPAAARRKIDRISGRRSGDRGGTRYCDTRKISPAGGLGPIRPQRSPREVGRENVSRSGIFV